VKGDPFGREVHSIEGSRGNFASFSRISNHPSGWFLRAGDEKLNRYRGRGREGGLAPHIPAVLCGSPLPRLFDVLERARGLALVVSEDEDWRGVPLGGASQERKKRHLRVANAARAGLPIWRKPRCGIRAATRPHFLRLGDAWQLALRHEVGGAPPRMGDTRGCGP